MAGQDVATVTGKQWRDHTIWNMLRSRRYLGELRHGEFVNTAAHEPLIDESTWALAQAHNVRAPMPRRHPALLRGVLRCAGCRRLLYSSTIGRYTSTESRLYVCPRGEGDRLCPAPVISATPSSNRMSKPCFGRSSRGWPAFGPSGG